MTQWEMLAVMVSSWAAVLALIEGYMRRRRERLDEQRDEASEAMHRIETRLVKLEVDQFGSNHGGLRQQVNTIDAKVDKLSEAIAEMRGEMSAK